MPETLFAQVARHESLRLKPYWDTSVPPKLTIGFGRNLTDNGISEPEAVMLLERDISDAGMDLLTFAWFKGLPLARENALIDMRFNLGPGRFRGFKAMLAALDRGDSKAAAHEMRHSTWYGQVGSRGEELARMVETGLPIDT